MASSVNFKQLQQIHHPTAIKQTAPRHKQVADLAQRRFQCSYCGDRFNNLRNLNSHHWCITLEELDGILIRQNNSSDSDPSPTNCDMEESKTETAKPANNAILLNSRKAPWRPIILPPLPDKFKPLSPGLPEHEYPWWYRTPKRVVDLTNLPI